MSSIIWKLERAADNTTKKRLARIEKEFRNGDRPYPTTLRDGQNELAKNQQKLEDGLYKELYDALGRTEKVWKIQLDDMATRIKVLEEIVKESGLITDYSSDEVKIREDAERDKYTGLTYHRHNVAYQINQVKTV